MAVSIYKVAEVAEVSPRTAYRALNNEPHIHPQTRRRVLEAARRLNYQPNIHARNLVLQKTNTIGIIFPDSRNPVFGEFANFIDRRARSRGYDCYFLHSEGEPDREAKFLNLVFYSSVDGLIVFPNFLDVNRELYSQLIVNRIPLVLRGGPELLLGVDNVTLDLERAGHLATRHLLDLGHTHIGILNSKFAMGHLPGRIVGYQKAHQEKGLPVHPAYQIDCGHRLEDGYRAIGELLARQPQITALFCHNDYLALAAFRVAREMNRRVPHDLAVVGLDDIELGQYCEVPLTTVSHMKVQEAETLVDLLCDRIETPDHPPRRVVLKPELVVRESCGVHLARG
ncbi:MAG: LacI family DNA-binding transcriptional regulator [Planctomycetes bacterium]|nr:LacI family DNA-binding transcriptional regulator [Planctomycetota bacterium]